MVWVIEPPPVLLRVPLRPTRLCAKHFAVTQRYTPRPPGSGAEKYQLTFAARELNQEKFLLCGL